MIKVTKESVVCVSCGHRCSLTDKDSDITKRCPLQKISVWPSKNGFFVKGIIGAISSRYENIFIRGIVFVDFSIVYIRFFLNPSWMIYLKSTGLNIILVCDNHMEPLANYWLGQEAVIKAVITNKKKINEIRKIVNQIIYGMTKTKRRRLLSLSHDEVKFLELAINGNSLISIGKEMNSNMKRIYNIKESIRNKTGVSLHKFLTKQ